MKLNFGLFKPFVGPHFSQTGTQVYAKVQFFGLIRPGMA